MAYLPPGRRYTYTVALLVLLFVGIASAQYKVYDRPKPGVSIYTALDSISVQGGAEKTSRQIIPLLGFDTFAVHIKYDTTTGTGVNMRMYVEASRDGRNFDLSILADSTNVTDNGKKVFKSAALVVPYWALRARCRVVNEAGNTVHTSARVAWIIGYRGR